jgi:allantoin racemase
MTTILVINPNTSARTTEMMVSVAQPLVPSGFNIVGVSAAHGVPMIVNEFDLAASIIEVVRIGREKASGVGAIMVAAFGSSGADILRQTVRIPVIGIGEAAIMEAAAGERRFGIATTTPALVGSIEAGVRKLSLERNFTGVRLPDGDPLTLAASPAKQDAALIKASADCIELDGAEAVVIGGGPLSASAARLRHRFTNDIIEPVPAAIRYLLKHLAG